MQYDTRTPNLTCCYHCDNKALTPHQQERTYPNGPRVVWMCQCLTCGANWIAHDDDVTFGEDRIRPDGTRGEA